MIRKVLTFAITFIAISVYCQETKKGTFYIGNTVTRTYGFYFGMQELGINYSLYNNFGLLANIKTAPPLAGVDRDFIFIPNFNLSYNINLIKKEEFGLQLTPYAGVNYQLPYKNRINYSGEITMPARTTINYGLLINSNFYKGFGVYGNINADGVFLGISKRF